MYDFTTPIPNAMYPYQRPIQRVEVIHVNGRAGADAYQLPPNSSVLLLDETNPLIYLKQSDGGGYSTVTAYSITPYTPPTVASISSLEERIRKIEEAINESNHEQTQSDK